MLCPLQCGSLPVRMYAVNVRSGCLTRACCHAGMETGDAEQKLQGPRPVAVGSNARRSLMYL